MTSCLKSSEMLSWQFDAFRPVTNSIISTVIAPGRRILGDSPVQSIIVDSNPTSDGPSSRTESVSFKNSPSSSITASAVVGDT